ncbi:tRNA (adenosine(37)-N6)-threonylcarbamoyltransferase complex ATPase subunit type 1 TsaE [Pseudobdellovibrio exovorus]|uniref:tRNA threonylcarbamoyladenosine biosynthesis protein TsaE n=1 Tax=Pseudobdellovibrio exovorus JSS TaxID=1184267 RepID=M4VQZ6_9BACT|nr:tRNA (adenosine(37)-N6)-threonylcarbamoyltransferase complex ATPase subunit type 1 TsaE [Pseudobdellovibrio exovorus]AGH95584.1 putative ATPase/GTPase [Pseudobdellovibrio exovorus JSS]
MTPIWNRTISSEAELNQIANEIATTCAKGSILLLSGDLAAGKTTFVVHFCQRWGLKLMQSPTYAIHQRYANEQIVVDHFDLYRLETEEELESAGVYDLLNQASDYKLIEWPERLDVQSIPLTQNLYGLSFRIEADGKRTIQFFEINR